jgi:hypothetical protein
MEILDKYHDWTVLDKTIIRKKQKPYLKCRCACGLEKEVSLGSMKGGQSHRCSSCAGKRITLPEGFTNSWKGTVINGLNRTMFSHIKSKARERSLNFEVTQEFLADLIAKQNYKCALSGLEITLSLKIKNGNSDFSYITASLDRVDSKKGYTEDNVQWVHKDINKMKMAYDNQYFIDMCKLIANNN